MTEIESVFEELRKVLGEVPILAAEQVRLAFSLKPTRPLTHIPCLPLFIFINPAPPRCRNSCV
jgi:hypothetical protein